MFISPSEAFLEFGEIFAKGFEIGIRQQTLSKRKIKHYAKNSKKLRIRKKYQKKMDMLGMR
ncbi:MAG: hypothetical protein FWE33_04655 [Defluviitaleaceae bacterium]|nr:hypothetical protein [Defluviitaleaceae bacterium]